MSEPRRQAVRSAGWTMDDHLVFAIGFALPRAPVRGMRRALTEDERRRIAAAVVKHLRCAAGHSFSASQRGHGAGVGGAPSE
ncbi:MAG TPA: hypothetical protein VK281_14630 [Xanthobacteraceae bacterium]|nr:hypothetical protein [Xanthobacteraceae bacterium]